jgi:hypothetical protein
MIALKESACFGRDPSAADTEPAQVANSFEDSIRVLIDAADENLTGIDRNPSVQVAGGRRAGEAGPTGSALRER